MKKTFLLLPITAAVLAGCTSSTPAPVESVDGTLPSQPIQPIDNPTTTSSWEPQVQQSSMPAGMNAPVVNQPVANQVGTMANPAAVNGQPQFNQQLQTQPTTTTKTVCKAVQKTKAAGGNQSQSVEIPRNTQTNAPDYTKIDKGFYKGNEYTVKKGDTMFLIAYIAGIDVRELAALNSMSEPYTLKVGQTLKVSNGSAAVTTEQECTEVTVPAQPQVTYTQAANGTQYGSDGTVTGPVKAGVGSSSTVAAPVAGGVVAGVGTAATNAPSYSSSSSQAVAPASNLTWQWPTTGKVVQGFSNADGGNKGIDISGSKGQPIYAAAPGRVVYAGNALRGYGNLIIIKHDNNFLSAYAHNDSISVSDQQQVKAGQQIAKMGSTGTTSTKLHFEIRYEGKSVDPTRYLPRR